MPETSLESLITECPSCHTRFRVSESQLRMAAGRVRCGACLFVFVATDYLVAGAPVSQRQSAAQTELDQLLDELARDVPIAARPPRRETTTPRPSLAESEPADENDVERAAPAHMAPPDAGSLQAAGASDSPGLEGPGTVAPAETASGDVVVEEIAMEEVPTAGSAPDAPAVVAVPDAMQAPSPTPDLPAQPSAASPAETASGPGEQSAPSPSVPASVGPRRRRRAEANRARTVEGIGDLAGALVAPAVVTPPTRRRWWLPFAVVLAALALVAQVLWFQFDIWSRDLQFRPIYERICPYVGCRLPVLRALEAMHSRNLVVRSHPDMPGALLVDALLVNEAPYAQPFPLIELRFSSMEGQLVAGRRFKPSEYLAGELHGAAMIEPMTPVHISLEIEDPGADAVNYVMVFR